MMNTKFQYLAFIFLVLLAPKNFAQTGTLQGQVIDKVTQTPLPSVNIILLNTDPLIGASTDINGNFIIEAIPTGIYTIQARFLGYETQSKTDVVIQSSRPTVILFELTEAVVSFEDELTVEADAFAKNTDTPTSIKTLEAEEIRRTPGGQNDISRSLLSLPGVIGSVDNRNDLLVRGGGPGENAYFLDGIEIPQINHFATQGATGGPLGLVNVDFIRESEFYTGGFPARYGDALSSLLVINNRDGSPDAIAGDFTLGASEAGINLDGPLGEKGNWFISARRSYLQFLFELIELPILPSYWDFQTKVAYNLDAKNRLTFVGLGAIDDFDINVPDDADFDQQETADRIFDNDQWGYTNGLVWRHLFNDGFFNLALSRSMNEFQFTDTDRETEEIVFQNTSQESENRLRLDADKKLSSALTLGFGGGTTYSRIAIDFFEKARPGNAIPFDLTFQNTLLLWKTFGYGQLVGRFDAGKLTTTLGLRYDGNSFISQKHYLSPRFSASYNFTPTWSVNTAIGIFNQAPEYLYLSVQDEQGDYVNQDLAYTQATHYILGVAWQARPSVRITLEGFYKDYAKYPVSKNDNRLSLANLGGDFGFVGAIPLESVGVGRAYGIEFFTQKKLVERWYGLLAYSLVWSEFSGKDGILKPSSWDVRNTFSLTTGYRVGRKWELGLKWRYLSGYPFTPFDLEKSSAEYAITGRGVPDYDLLNTERMPPYHRLDMRIDRRFSFSTWNGVFYVDIQNLYNRKNLFGYTYSENPSYPDFRRPQEQIGLLPNIGFSIEW